MSVTRLLHQCVIEAVERRTLLSGTPLTGTVIGTAGSYNNHGTVGANAFDGNLNTYFDAPTASGSYAGLDLKTPQVLSQISYAPRSGWASRMVGGVFQASNKADFSSGVVTLYTVTTTPATATLTTVPVSNPGSFEFVRYLGPANSYCDIAEAQFFGAAASGSITLQTNGTLLVAGTSGADAIAYGFSQISQPTISVSLNGVNQSFPWASVKSIVINTYDGNDSFSASGYLDSRMQQPPIHINSGNGNDSFSDQRNSDNGGGQANTQISIIAGNGNDSFDFNGSDQEITVVAGDGADQFYTNIFGNGGLDANINAGNGTNTLTTGSSGGSGSQSVTYNAGYGNDYVFNLDFDDHISGTIGGQAYSVAYLDEKIIGNVYADRNGDQIYETGEPTVSNFPVSFQNTQDGKFGTVTDSHGNYQQSVAYDYYAAFGIRTFGANSSFIVTPGELISGVDIALKQPVGGAIVGTSGSYRNSGNTVAKAFDGNLSTYFDGPTGNGNYAGRNLGSKTVITSIAYAPRSGWAARMVGGVFQGSNSANFSEAVNLYTITSTPATGVLTYAAITNPTAFQYVRYLSPNGSYGDVAEVQFFTTPPVPTGGDLGSNGLLTVTGTAAADKITVAINYHAPGTRTQTITTTINSIVQTFSAPSVKGIVINSGDGGDSITVTGTYDTVSGNPGFDPGGDLATTINSGNGNDTILTNVYTNSGSYEAPSDLVNLGSGNDSVLISQDGTSTVNGGAGNDTIDSNSVDGLVLTVYGGSGTTLVNRGIFTTDLFHGGTGVNTYIEGNAPQYNNLNADVNLNGPDLTNIQNYFNYNDNQNISVEASSVTAQIVLPGSENSVTVTGGSGDEYINVVAETAQITTGNGNNTVYINAATSGSVTGGSGNDTIDAADSGGPVVIDGGGGTNTAYTNSQATVTNIQVLNPQFTSPYAGTLQATAGSYQNDGNTAAKAVDGNLANYFDGPTANGNYVGLDLGGYRRIGSIAYAPRVGYSQRMVGGYFEASDSPDFTAPTVLFTIDTAPVAGQFTTFTFGVPIFQRYIRYVSPDGSFGDVAEIQIQGPVAMP